MVSEYNKHFIYDSLPPSCKLVLLRRVHGLVGTLLHVRTEKLLVVDGAIVRIIINIWRLDRAHSLAFFLVIWPGSLLAVGATVTGRLNTTEYITKV